MKRKRNARRGLVLLLLLSVLVVFSVQPMTVSAAISADAQTCATLGILLGEGQGVTEAYLAKTSTRLQAAIVTLRLAGKEAEALAYIKDTGTFTDAGTLTWTQGKHVLAYLKANPQYGWGGFPDGSFKPNDSVSAPQMLKVMLESLLYQQDYDFVYADVVAFATLKGFTQAVRNAAPFTNNSLASALVQALKMKPDGTDATLVQKLINMGILTYDKAVSAGFTVSTKATYTMSDVANMTAPGVLPIVTTPVTLTVGIVPTATVTDYVNNKQTKWLEKNTGVKVEFFMLPATGAPQKIELMVASGQKLPDIVATPNITNISMDAFYQGGIVVPLEKLMKKYCFYQWQMYRKWCEQSDVNLMYNYARTFDGTLIKFPMIYGDATNTFNPLNTVWVNLTWLKAVNMKMPTTTDEYYNLLKAFRDTDINKNGKKDEIPLLFPALDTGNNIVDTIISSFVYAKRLVLDNCYLDQDANGKLYSAAATDDYKAAMTYLNKLCSEGLLSKNSFTMNLDQFKPIVNAISGTETVGSWIYHPVLAINDANYRDTNFYFAWPMYGPKGLSYAIYYPQVFREAIFVTKYCTTPEIAVRWLDYFAEEETMLRVRWGDRPADWDYAKPGSDCTFQALGFRAFYGYTFNPWASSNNAIWKVTCMQNCPGRLMNSQESIPNPEVDVTKATYWSINQLLAKWNKFPAPAVHFINYNSMESNAKKDIATSLATYIYESQSRFITGDLSVTNDWAAYIKKLNDIGLQEYLGISQAAFDRMK
jgi:putative aldouronate transport system substrate-binding protein